VHGWSITLGYQPTREMGGSMSPSHKTFGREKALKTKVPGVTSHEEYTDSELSCVKQL